MRRRPPRSTRTDTLFPYTTLFRSAQAAAKRMIAQGVAGSLIHIGSQMGHVGAPNRSLYCASKWALEGMNKAIALDLDPHRIRSTTLAPTFIETPLTNHYLPATPYHHRLLATPTLGRTGQPND